MPIAQRQVATEAMESFVRGDYQTAEKKYEDLAAVLPENRFVLSGLAATQFRLDKLDLAKRTLERAISIYPEDVFSYALLGSICYRQRQYDVAAKMFGRVVALDPKDASAHEGLKLVYAQQNQMKRAEEEHQKACELDSFYIRSPTR